jgi:hypothetical protein
MAVPVGAADAAATVNNETERASRWARRYIRGEKRARGAVSW